MILEVKSRNIKPILNLELKYDLRLPIQYWSDEERKLCRYPVSVADFGSARKPPALLQN